MNAEEISQLLNILKYFEGFFDGTLGDWDKEPVDLELKPDSKLIRYKYYPVPRINKEDFRKDIKGLV